MLPIIANKAKHRRPIVDPFVVVEGVGLPALAANVGRNEGRQGDS